jgi:allantoin racemase
MGLKLKIVFGLTGISDEEIKTRINILKKYLRPDTTLDAVRIDEGPETLESEYEFVLIAPHTTRKIVEAEREGYDAVINWLAPGTSAARELVDIPVIDPLDVNTMFSVLLGAKYSIVNPVPTNWHALKGLGIDLENKLASIRNMGELNIKDVMRMRKSEEGTEKLKKLVIEVAKKCIEEDGAHVIQLGFLSGIGLGKDLSEALGVPVVDPALIMVKFAELMADLYRSTGLSYSRRTYQKPKISPI